MKNIGSPNSTISVLKDPFKQNMINSISLEYRKVMFEKYFSWRGTVRFKNGNTSGQQDFEVTDVESEDAFSAISIQIQEFINTL